MRHAPVAAPVAPWIRTRLRAAPLPALALALLVLATAFLAAVFPRAVDAYESEGVRGAVAGAGAARTGIELAAPAPGLEADQHEREEALRGPALRDQYREVVAAMPRPLRVDRAQSTYGARTLEPPEGLDRWLPRPTSIAPQFTLAAQADVGAHARVREGRLPKGEGLTSDSRRVEAAVTADTARALKLRVGTAVHVGSVLGERVTVRITGIVAPRRPKDAYWSYDPVLRTPALIEVPGGDPQSAKKRWHAALLLAPGAGPFLPAVDQNPQRYWRVAPDPGALTARDVPTLKEHIASLEGGPLRSELRGFTHDDALVSTGLDKVLGGYEGLRDAVTPIVAVAAYGIGGVAVVVLLMTCSLTAVRRRGELALLRARGGSVRGVAARLLAETSVAAVPAAAIGLLLAFLAVPHARAWPSIVAAAGVCALACAALPVRAAFAHRGQRTHEGRDDLVTARPSRRRTVAELVLLVLAVGAVVTLRRGGLGGSEPGAAGGSDPGDGSAGWLVSAAPLLVGGIAALLLVRFYPLPLRLFARPLARRRGAVGFLSTASAGRASAAQALPLLGLLLALTTAAFGGSVLTGIADARDRTALLAVGADVRVDRGDGNLPASLAAEIRGTPGVGEVAAVHIDWYLELPDHSTAPLVAVDPAVYARLTRTTGLGPFGEDELAAPGGRRATLPAVASPDVARRLGKGPHSFRTPAGSFRAAVGAVRSGTPALPADSAFLLIDRRVLDHPADTALLATGASGRRIDAAALNRSARAAGPGVEATFRATERASLTDSPLQSGAERIYTAAVAAGAGYAVLAVLLALLHSAPQRAALLARLRTMGLSKRQGRRLLVLESLPQAVLAACGGALAGWAAIALLAPGVDLAQVALAARGTLAGPGDVTLRADPWSLLVPAAGVVMLTGAVAFVQAWWTARHTAATDLKTGDTTR
ncbi:FtsX-like permease family protein [Streptomyces sp. NPDC057302]|uniref:FtsX-like permease family protein n=1 Tax=Streptomyces sp. NPDC057302 TaxID=3346094 RepID=UPI0036327B73